MLLSPFSGRQTITIAVGFKIHTSCSKMMLPQEESQALGVENQEIGIDTTNERTGVRHFLPLSGRALFSSCGRVSMFLIALPVTSAIYLWLLKLALPGVETFFQSQQMAYRVLCFYGGFCSLTVFLFPLAAIDVVAGLLFGLWMGWPLALTTKTSGSVLCFLLSRHTCRNSLRRSLVDHYEWLSVLGYMMEEKEFQTMALLRFSALPAAIKNYGSSSLHVSLGTFTLVTALALSLETTLLVPVGAHVKDMKDLVFTGGTSWYQRLVSAVGVVMLVVLIVTIRWKVNQRIKAISLEGGWGDRWTGGVSRHDVSEGQGGVMEESEVRESPSLLRHHHLEGGDRGEWQKLEMAEWDRSRTGDSRGYETVWR
ncbi:unnamed protein product [Choristocarpus tenellus]